MFCFVFRWFGFCYMLRKVCKVKLLLSLDATRHVLELSVWDNFSVWSGEGHF